MLSAELAYVLRRKTGYLITVDADADFFAESIIGNTENRAFEDVIDFV